MADTRPLPTAPIATRRFLVGAVRSFLTGAETPGEPPPESDADWGGLVGLAVFHRTAPLLDRALREGWGPSVPAPVRAELAAHVRSLAGRSLLLTGELVRVLEGLETQGVPAIPFKGPALAALLYGDPALRHFDDLDLLVRQEDLPAAKRTLLSLGYQPYEQHLYHDTFTLVRRNTEIAVEVHWRMTIMPEAFPFAPDSEGMWGRCEAQALGGATVTALSPEDLLLLLCAHGARHLWLRLQWLCDVAQLVRRPPGLDWERVIAEARRARGQRMLWLGLVLAGDVLGAPLPPEVEQEARRDLQTAELARQVKWRLFEGPLQLFKPWKSVAFHLQVIDRPWDRCWYRPRLWLRALTLPQPADRSGLPLPRALAPLYYVLRPARLAGKYGLRAIRQLFHRRPGA